MITTSKTGHFRSPFCTFLDKKRAKSGKKVAVEGRFVIDLVADEWLTGGG
jgi:hypothetical protein